MRSLHSHDSKLDVWQLLDVFMRGFLPSGSKLRLVNSLAASVHLIYSHNMNLSEAVLIRLKDFFALMKLHIFLAI